MTDRIIVSRHPAAIEFIARHVETRPDRAPAHVACSCNGPDYGACATCRVAGTVYLALSPDWMTSNPDGSGGGYVGEQIPVLASATAEDVRGKVVYGNLPLHLAAWAVEVHAIEFTGDAPRGAEYTLADMDAAEAHLACYRVRAI